MNRFTKIVLERLKQGDIGLKLAPSAETLKYLSIYGNATVETFQVIERLGNIKRKKSIEIPATLKEIAESLKDNPRLKQYSNGSFLIVLDQDSQVTDDKESKWYLSVINLDKTDLYKAYKIKSLESNNLAKVGYSFVVDTDQYAKLKAVPPPKVATARLGSYGPRTVRGKRIQTMQQYKDSVPDSEWQNFVDSELDPNFEKEMGRKSYYADEIRVVLNKEKQKSNVKDVVNVTNAKFQQVLNDFYIKFNLTGESEYKNFVRTSKRPDGSWDGDIGTRTEAAIQYVRDGLEPEYTGNNINDFTKRLQDEIDAAVNESVNYFKGNNIEVSLLQLFEQSLKEDFNKEKADAARKEKPKVKPKVKSKVKPKVKPEVKPKVSSKEKISDKDKEKVTVNKIIRQKNGFLISKSSLDIFKKDYKKYPIDTTGKELGAKKLMYGKNFKIRNGIGATDFQDELGMEGVWRGYQQVNPEWADPKGNISAGFLYRNISNTRWDNVKKGTSLNVKITAVKFIVGPYYGKPEPNIYTYVYCTTPNADKGFWGPTTWITLN